MDRMVADEWRAAPKSESLEAVLTDADSRMAGGALTFNALLGALANGTRDDPCSRWFAGYLRIVGSEIVAGPSNSASDVMEGAYACYHGEKSAAEDGAKFDVRHVLGACIYYSDKHEEELRRYNLRRSAWSNGYINYIAGYRSGEKNYWANLHKEDF